MAQDVVLQKAFEEMRLVLRDATVSEQWRHEMLGQLASMRGMAQEYVHAKAKEDKLLANGALMDKDHPPINRFTKNPKRRSGFISPQHSIEYQLSTQADAFFTSLQNSPLGAADREEAVECFRGVLEALDDRGVVLGQMKDFATKKSLPQEYDDKKPRPDILPTNRVAEFFREGSHLRDPEAIKGQRFNKASLFQRINQEQSDEKKR